MTTRLWTLAIVLGLAACGKSSTAETPRALTEYDFAADPTLRLDVGQVGVTFLEATDEVSSRLADTCQLGVDVIPLRVSESGTFTYELDSLDTPGTVAKVELREGQQASVGTGGSAGLIATLSPASPSATVKLAPGDYDLVVYSGYTAAEEVNGPRTLFLRPGLESRAASLDYPRGAGVAAHSPESFKVWLALGRSCWYCNLTYMQLDNLNLAGALLTGARLDYSTLRNTNLNNALLRRATMRGTNLFGANLARANLADADLSGATWIDGVKICAEGSIGECK